MAIIRRTKTVAPWETEVWDRFAGNPNPNIPTAPTGFNVSPPPTTGQGAFGMVPGQLGMPDPFGDISGVYPGLKSANQAISRNIASELSGSLSPQTTNALWDIANRFGVASGMPGAGLFSNAFLGNIAGAIEGRKRQGLEDYSRFVPTLAGTQTVQPALQTQIALQNAVNAAAPDPSQSASYAQQLFNRYANSLGGGSGMRPSGGTGAGSTYAGDTQWNQLTMNRAQMPSPFGTPPIGPAAGPSSFFAPPPVNVGLPTDMPPAPMIDPFGGFVGGPPPADWEEGLF